MVNIYGVYFVKIEKMLASPKNHQKSVACPILACPLLQKNDFWPVLWPVLISAPPVLYAPLSVCKRTVFEFTIVFFTGQDFCTKFDPVNYLFKRWASCHLKRMILEICEHSSFSLIDEIVSYFKHVQQILISINKKIECSQIFTFLRFKTIRSACRTQYHLWGQILYRSPVYKIACFLLSVS